MLKLIDHPPTPFDGTPVLRPESKTLAPTRTRRVWLFSLSLLPIMLTAGFGFSRLRSEPAAPPTSSGNEKPALQAKSVLPVRQTIRKILEQPGRIEGYEQTPIHVKIPGFVTKWNADIGQQVAEGDVLAEVFVPEEREELKRREAAVELARGEVTAAETALEAAKAEETRSDAVVAQVKATKTRTEANVARWNSEFKRVREAHARGVSSATDYDTTQDQMKTAEAADKEAEAGITAAIAAKASTTASRVKAEANVMVAKAKLGVATADARRQSEWLNYATIRAPFGGLVVQRNVDRGQYVTPPASGVNQTPLFVIVRADTVRVFVDVPETEAALISEKMPVMVRVQAQSDREISGTVTRFSWALDATTRTLRVQIDLPNGDGLLRPGMFATAKFVTERPGAWVVPASVVSTAEEQPFAVLVAGGKGVKLPVKLGARQNGMVELVHKQSGLATRGEPIVWEPLNGSEEFLTSRPMGWTDGATVSLTR